MCDDDEEKANNQRRSIVSGDYQKYQQLTLPEPSASCAALLSFGLASVLSAEEF